MLAIAVYIFVFTLINETSEAMLENDDEKINRIKPKRVKSNQHSRDDDKI